MSIAGKIKQDLRRMFLPIRETDAEKAYDIWAQAYDNQPLNLMLELDRELFARLTQGITIRGSRVIDIGCGTGRHWYDLIKQEPARLVGYDVSKEMLVMLEKKFPAREVYRQTSHLVDQPTDGFDLLLSTLTVAHIPDIKSAIKEWARVVKPGGDVIITDYHPATLTKGGQRTFAHEGKTIAVKNYVYHVNDVLQIAIAAGLEPVKLIEQHIDESMQSWYEKQQALAVYEKYKGTAIIYGVHLKKKNAVN